MSSLWCVLVSRDFFMNTSDCFSFFITDFVLFNYRGKDSFWWEKVPVGQEFFPNVQLPLPEVHIDETKFRGVADQFMGAMKVKLVHYIGAVVFNGFWAYE